jgi:hypothetical protein
MVRVRGEGRNKRALNKNVVSVGPQGRREAAKNMTQSWSRGASVEDIPVVSDVRIAMIMMFLDS